MKHLISLLSAILISLHAYAIPARPGQWRLLTLKNGQQVNAELRGDEFCHYWQTASGDCYVEGSEEGSFEQADRPSIAERASARHTGRRRGTRSIGGQHEPYTGKKKGLIILVEFQNKKFLEEHSHALYEDILNKVGFTSDAGFKGSVKDYFLDQSHGLFELDFDIVGPLTLPKTYGYYGANTQGNDTNPGLMAATACEMADEFVDFKDYDWDGDGEVDQVFIIFAGLGEAAGGDANTIWPHEWSLQYSDYGKTLTLDGVTVDTYACGPELIERGVYTSNIGIDGIGTICHEFSHCLGLPDMYDTGGNNYGMANWDLMASGSYNGNSFSPAGFTSYERMYCGWQEPIVLQNDTVVTAMKAIGEGGESYIIYNDAHPEEYYLLENRQQSGWDEGLASSGLLVLHIDYDEELWAYNLVNNTTSYNGYNSHQRCTIIPADNNLSRTDIATDVFPYGEKDSLTNLSLPRAELYNLNAEGIHYMSKPVTQIKQEDGLVSFVFKNQTKGTDPAGILPLPASTVTDPRIYDLHGRQLGTDMNALPHGIYIIDGKKIVK